MKGEQFKELAQYRLNEAYLLYANGYHQGAYYLAGYAAEFSVTLNLHKSEQHAPTWC